MAVVDALKGVINFLTDPPIFITLAGDPLLRSLLRARRSGSPRSPLAVGVLAAAFLAVSMLDPNFALIVKKPDNVPIVAMLFLVGFFLWLAHVPGPSRTTSASRGASRRSRRADGEDEKTWVWPDLVYTELLCMVIGMIVLVVWGMAFHAPIEEPANPARTPNPSKAPWYFLGPAGDARLLRPLAGGRRVPEPDHRGPDGHPLHRH